MNWPGENSGDNTVRKYRPKITSDCAQYQYGSSWIYIACCQDSAVSGGYRTCVKTARINNPYTTLPPVTYMAGPYYFNDFVAAPDSYVDLAYYRDFSGGSIVVLQSNVPVNSFLYMTRSVIQDFTTVSSYMGSLDGGTTRQKKFGCISSNGYYHNLMITNFEVYSAEDIDIQYFASSNSGSGWSTGYVDYTANRSYRPDIMERKNVVGEFYIAYADLDTLNKIHFSKATGSVWGSIVPQMNHINASPYPRPCYRTSGSDNCFVIWSEGSSNVWVSAGCNGSVVLNNNLKLNLYIQGRYRPVQDKMVGDTFQIQIRNNFSPYAIVGTAKSFQGDDGIGSYNFPTVVNGTNYYIVVRHRNSIETWSKLPGQSFSAGILNYNFFSLAQAYGNNLTEVDEVPYRFGIYTGDVNQDGVIDASDIAFIDNSAFNFLTGYVLGDLTGDYTVDGSDYAIADNNAFNFISRIRP